MREEEGVISNCAFEKKLSVPRMSLGINSRAMVSHLSAAVPFHL